MEHSLLALMLIDKTKIIVISHHFMAAAGKLTQTAASGELIGILKTGENTLFCTWDIYTRI